jgi:YbbR domain-containing protein
MKRQPVDKELLEKKTRPFFRNFKWKDLLVFLVFVCIASVFWMMQYFRQTDAHDEGDLARNTHPETTLAVVDSLPKRGKEVPVRIVGSLLPAPGYRFIDTLRIEPPTVWVYGEEAILDTLKWIQTIPVHVEKIQKSLHFQTKLQVPRGLSAPVRKVSVSADLEEYAEKRMEIPIVCLNLPEEVEVRFFPSAVEAGCYLSLADYGRLKADDIEIGVDYGRLMRNDGTSISLSVLRKPSWLDNCRITPENVEYLIEQKRNL